MDTDTTTSGQAVVETNKGGGDRGQTATAVATVTLVTGSYIRRSDGSQDYDKGQFDFALGDTVKISDKATSTSSLYVDLGDGGIVELKPGGMVVGVPAGTDADDFDIELDVGTGVYSRASTTTNLTMRRKMLRSPGVIVAAIGTVYTWSIDLSGVSIVKLNQGVSITLSSPGLWQVDLRTGQQTSFKDMQANAPTATSE